MQNLLIRHLRLIFILFSRHENVPGFLISYHARKAIPHHRLHLTDRNGRRSIYGRQPDIWRQYTPHDRKKSCKYILF